MKQIFIKKNTICALTNKDLTQKVHCNIYKVSEILCILLSLLHHGVDEAAFLISVQLPRSEQSCLFVSFCFGFFFHPACLHTCLILLGHSGALQMVS